MTTIEQHNQDNLVWTLTLNNGSQTKLLKAEYSETRAVPIISGATDGYEVAVDRFSIPATMMPLFLFEEAPNQAQPAPGAPGDCSTGYWIATQLDNGPITKQFLELPERSDVTAQLSSQPWDRAIFNFSTFLSSFNAAFRQLWARLTIPGIAPFAQLEAGGYVGLFVDPVNSPFSFSWSVPGRRIFFNSHLYSLIQLPATYQKQLPASDQVVDDGLGWCLLFNLLFRVSPNTVIDPFSQEPITTGLLKLQQESPSLGRAMKFRRVLFCSNSLPIQSEFIASNEQRANGSSSHRTKLLTDFYISADTASLRSDVEYVPTNRRWLSLEASQDLRSIDVTVLFQGRNSNETVPAFLMPSESMDLKLYFRPKRRTVFPPPPNVSGGSYSMGKQVVKPQQSERSRGWSTQELARMQRS